MSLKRTSHLTAWLLATGLLAACTSMAGGELAGCDGRDRRPANPWGSILTEDARPEEALPAISPARPAPADSRSAKAGDCQ